MADLEYAYEKLAAAVTGMAEGTGSLRDRLWNAWISHLHKLGSPISPLPEPLLGRFEILLSIMTTQEDPEAGSLAATIEAMDDEALDEAAAHVMSLFLQVVEARVDADR